MWHLGRHMMSASTKRKPTRRAKRSVRASELYGAGASGNLMQGRYSTNVKVLRYIKKRHKRYGRLIDENGFFRYEGHKWKVPFGVRLCLRRTLVNNQITVRYPWAVVWRSPKTGKRLKKYFSTPYQAIVFITTKAQYVDSRTALIARSVGYDIPPQLRGRIPKPWKWCPNCMGARRFKAVDPQEVFFAQVKVWNEKKFIYEYRDRKLRLMRCEICGCTNRDRKFRRSNQPWETRKFKPGVRRAKKRRR